MIKFCVASAAAFGDTFFHFPSAVTDAAISGALVSFGSGESSEEPGGCSTVAGRPVCRRRVAAGQSMSYRLLKESRSLKAALTVPLPRIVLYCPRSRRQVGV